MLKQLTGYLIGALLITQLAGCATGAKAPGMTVLDSEVSVSVNPIFASNIDVGFVYGGKKPIHCGSQISVGMNSSWR